MLNRIDDDNCKSFIYKMKFFYSSSIQYLKVLSRLRDKRSPSNVRSKRPIYQLEGTLVSTSTGKCA